MEMRKKLVEEHNEEEISKIEDDLKKLNEVFRKVNNTKVIGEDKAKNTATNPSSK